MAWPKREPGQHRIILDLSFPLGHSVNSSIPKVIYEGGPYKLHLPTPLDLAELIAARRPGAMMYKVDLEFAYRQLPSDPYDWPLLGIGWEQDLYVDKAIPFVLRHGTMVCQRVTEAVCHIIDKENDSDSVPYIDDFGAVTLPDSRQANNAYIRLKTWLLNLGLGISWDKCRAPLSPGSAQHSIHCS